MPAQDLNEPFDVCDEEGRPTGLIKPRGLVHRDGDWHRSVHVWVLLEGDASEEPLVLFQRRSSQKDTWPGALDVAVAGHLGAGEDELDGLREAKEEIGVELGRDDVTRLGRRWCVDRSRPGLLDREIQTIYLALVAGPLALLTPHPEEVAALVTARLADAKRLVLGGETIDGSELTRGVARPIRVEPSELVRSSDGYYARALEAIDAQRRGALEPFVIR